MDSYTSANNTIGKLILSQYNEIIRVKYYEWLRRQEVLIDRASYRLGTTARISELKRIDTLNRLIAKRNVIHNIQAYGFERSSFLLLPDYVLKCLKLQ